MPFTEQDFMQFLSEYPEVIPYIQEDPTLIESLVLDPTFRQEVETAVQGERGMAPQQTSTQPEAPAPVNRQAGTTGVPYNSSGLSNEEAKYQRYPMPERPYEMDRTTRETNLGDISQQGYTPAGQLDKNVSRINYSYLPEGMAPPTDNNFAVGAHVITGKDGNAILGSDGNPLWEYRPRVYYDETGTPTYAPKATQVLTKGGKVGINSKAYGLDNEYGYETQQVMGFKTPMVEVYSPATGKWEKTSKGIAETSFRNMVEGGYASAADKAKYIRDTGEFSTAADYQNGQIQAQNDQNRFAMNNKMYSDNPRQALSFRDQQKQDNDAYKTYLKGQPNKTSPAAAKPQVSTKVPSQHKYENFDSAGKSLGFTYGESGKSNYLSNAASVKAENGKTYQTNIKTAPAVKLNSGLNNFSSTVAKPKAPAKTAAVTPKALPKSIAKIPAVKAATTIKDKLLSGLRKGK